MTDKQEVRERVWEALTRAGVARFPGAMGRIPNFTGAERAAERLAARPEWQSAAALKSNPDLPQLPVRARALAEGRRLYLAVPRLTEPLPFLLLDPADPAVGGARPRQVASIKGAGTVGRPTAVADLPHLDLVVCGSVAVDRRGVRVGKGGGFSDIEYGLLIEAGKIDDHTVVATTAHPIQVVRENLMMTAHDLPVDTIATPRAVIEVERDYTRPRGILWDHLQPPQIHEIPILERMGYA